MFIFVPLFSSDKAMILTKYFIPSYVPTGSNEEVWEDTSLARKDHASSFLIVSNRVAMMGKEQNGKHEIADIALICYLFDTT